MSLPNCSSLPTPIQEEAIVVRGHSQSLYSFNPSACSVSSELAYLSREPPDGIIRTTRAITRYLPTLGSSPPSNPDSSLKPRLSRAAIPRQKPGITPARQHTARATLQQTALVPLPHPHPLASVISTWRRTAHFKYCLPAPFECAHIIHLAPASSPRQRQRQRSLTNLASGSLSLSSIYFCDKRQAPALAITRSICPQHLA